MDDVTYGAAIVAAQSLETGDLDGLQIIQDMFGARGVALSTLQLSLIVLKMLPSGQLTDPPSENIRGLALSEFLTWIPKLSQEAAPLLKVKPDRFETAVGAIITRNIHPLMNGEFAPPAIDLKSAGFSDLQVTALFATVSLACLKSFENFRIMIPVVQNHPGTGVDFLRFLLASKE